MNTSPDRHPKALLFDVQGTVTDFHSTVRRSAERICGMRYPGVNWSEFVNSWRAMYFESTSRPDDLSDQWTTVDSIYRRSLDALLEREDLEEIGLAEREELNAAWQRLDPWPDAVPGLLRMRGKFALATLSNADVCAVISISRHGQLPWDAIFSAEMAGAFKPDPRTYLMACRYLGCDPGDVMMVASHKYDIRAAGALGMKTAFVARPDELGADAPADVEYSDEFDINAADFSDLATQLGC
ncbi:haloacid dehalogenase, type II [Rhodococcus sp. WMMA185]|uniref:haloacid dehalogenase type II n=1 Tax=Rhodococcus sp. WMMA185 TaxID=679318 RepID=UPI000878D3C5|nr:haloacid dehalogenase type II [Rhodococcus sp. WMMA185]AOW95257.1 haloacid dehalogenase, type II [Rhodococcus sp. WMMA185]